MTATAPADTTSDADVTPAKFVTPTRRLSLAKPVPISLEGEIGGGATARIRFAAPEYGVAPGQAAVLYAGETVVGSGVITEAS